MLEDTRKRGATIAIYVIFGILIAVFVINFGPGGGGRQNQGCSFASQKATLLTLDGNNYGMSSWQWALNTREGSESGQAGIQRKIAAMDLLVRRELLAMEAERRGLVIADSIIDEKLKRGELYILTQRLDGTRAFFEDGLYFNYKYLERWIGQFGLSIGSFKAEQRRELLAQAMLDELRAGAHVTRDETFSLWVHANTDVTLDAVAFPVETYKSKIVLSDADVDKFLADHEAEVKKKYEDDKPLAYTATPAKVHLHRVFVARTPTEKKDEPAPPTEGSGSGSASGSGSGTGTGSAADPAAGSGSGSGTGTGTGSGSAAVEEKPDPARAKLAKARAAIIAKTKKFGDVAKELDADEATRNKSGDLGWVSVDAPGLGKEVAAAVKLLTVPGDPSEIIDTPEGFWLVWATEKREGDLTYDQVKREIASALAAEHWGREAARRDALAALNDARAGKGKNLADMFEKVPEAPRPNPGGGGGLEELRRNIEEDLNDPSKSEEEKEQLRELIRKIDDGSLGAPSGTTGMTTFSYDELAAWGQDDAAPGDAGAVGAPEPPPPAEDINAPPSKEPLPKFVGVPKAQVQRIGPMPRDSELIADLGKSKELIAALFDELDEGALASKIYLVKLTDMGITGGDAFVIVQVIAKGKPELDKFDEQEASLRESMESDRADAIVSGWLTERCKKLSDLGKIKPAQDAMLVQQDGQQKAIPYTPCGGLDQ